MSIISNGELQTAISAVEDERGVHLDFDLAFSIVSKVNDMKNGMSFGEAIRYSLNELNIWDRDKRRLYSKVIGKYFGRRGGLKTVRMRKITPKPIEQKRKSATGTIFLEKTGQLAFKL